MSLETIVKGLHEKLQKHIISTFSPNTVGEIATFSTVSKFGGLPYLRNAKDWPVCPGCQKHMSFFLQLKLDEIPVKYADNKGLLQVFYCTTRASEKCEFRYDNSSPFSEGVVLRKIDIEGDSVAINLQENAIKPYPEKQVLSWEEEEDYPSISHHDDLGITAQFEDLGIDEDNEDEVFEILHDEDLIAMAGDKLGGWEHFLQYNQKIKDPKTGKEYVYLMQIDSEDNIPYMFGDSGIAFIGYDPDAPEKLAMFWQCY